MRDSREKGAGMRDQDPLPPPPFQTLIESSVGLISTSFFLWNEILGILLELRRL